MLLWLIYGMLKEESRLKVDNVNEKFWFDENEEKNESRYKKLLSFYIFYCI